MAIISVMLATSLAGAHAGTTPVPGDWADYRVMSVNAKQSVDGITIIVGPRSGGMRWWEMIITKPAAPALVIKALSERVPMVGADGDIGRVDRYQVKEGAYRSLEYRDKTLGGPFLPVFDFRTRLLPRPIPGSTLRGIFAATGTYLGNGIQLTGVGSGRALSDFGEVKTLTLDPSLIVGTGRPFRDIDEGRVTDRDYTYRAFSITEYDELEAAGFNFFMADSAEHETWIRERPVFYTKYPVLEDYPSILYRSNYRGCIMFTDEPAILTDFSACKRPADASNRLRMVVEESIMRPEAYGPRVLAAHWKLLGVGLGTWDLIQPDVPAWEAVFQATWHEIEGGVSGVIHEGRYDLTMFNQILKDRFGPGLEVNPEQMLALHYAYMRGAARCFGGTWGTSIYGQADPKISPLAVTMAYDMGARYVWFWTCDHGHHMPYREQLALARVVRDHEKSHPRKPIAELARKAKVAVAVPEGYIGWSEFWPTGIWNNPNMDFKKPNEEGATFGAVVTAALKQGVALARLGVSFDFVVDGEPARKAGYERIIRVLPNGAVENGQK